MNDGPLVGLVWAQAPSGVIGRDGVLPWRLPEDLAHFREVTDGCPVVMGRATWLSLPPRFRPLPGRANVVLSRDPAFAAPGALVVPSLEAALDAVVDAGGDAAAGTAGDAVVDAAGDAVVGTAVGATPPAAADGGPMAADDVAAWVIGGAAVYAAAMPLAGRLEVTEVDVDTTGDAFAPVVDPGRWEPALVGPWQTSRTGIRYRFLTYTPRA